jgi:hypothetical protein
MVEAACHGLQKVEGHRSEYNLDPLLLPDIRESMTLDLLDELSSEGDGRVFSDMQRQPILQLQGVVLGVE